MWQREDEYMRLADKTTRNNLKSLFAGHSSSRSNKKSSILCTCATRWTTRCLDSVLPASSQLADRVWRLHGLEFFLAKGAHLFGNLKLFLTLGPCSLAYCTTVLDLRITPFSNRRLCDSYPLGANNSSQISAYHGDNSPKL